MPIRDIDPELIDAARSGDRAAVESLLALCQPDLHRFARRACATAEDADDAVQEAMWVLSRRIGAVRTLSALAGWLFQVVRRECMRLTRRLAAAAAGGGPLDPSTAEAAGVVDAATAHDIAEAIAGLEPIDRDVVVLRDVRGCSGPDAARQLGLSLAATKSRLHRARAELRDRLCAYRPVDHRRSVHS